MAVRFILGTSGTGKTTFCISSIVAELAQNPNSNESIILLVPEQATYQAERLMLADKRIAGYSRLRVLSFDRLQFLLLKKRTAASEISRIGLEMIIQKILRTNSSKLKIFGEAAETQGLASKLAEVIADLHASAKSPEDVQELVNKLQKKQPGNLTSLKFADIGFVFEQYLKFISDRFVNPDIQLTAARQAVSRADFLKGARVWIDGFAGFTIQQRDLLAEILKTAAESHIALCLDASDFDMQNPDMTKVDAAGLFNPTARCFAELTEIIKKCKLKLEEPVILNQPLRFASSQALGHIERNLFSANPAATIEAKDDVNITYALNSRLEIEHVGRRIIKLIKEQNYRFRDIAVIAPDVSLYRHYIEAVFSDYGIPFFIDAARSLRQHPVIELITSSLQAALNGFASGDVLMYLKTDFAPVTITEVDLLENFCLAFGIDGQNWYSDEDWTFAKDSGSKFSQQRIDKIRRQAVAPLLELRNNLQGNGNGGKITAEQFTGAVFDFLNTLKVQQKTAQQITDRADENDEHLQLFDKLIRIFDELVEIFGAALMPAEDFAAIICNACSKLTLKLIPPTLDQVLVGSIQRSRHPDLKAVFLVGVTQKQFPVPISFDNILTGEDRKAIDSQEFELSEKLEGQLTARNYLAYIAFTRASNHLYISYPLIDDSASAVVPSPYVNYLKSLFTDLNEVYVSGINNNATDIYSKSELADLLCDRLGKDTQADKRQINILEGLSEELCKDAELAGIGRLVTNAVSYDNSAVLNKDFAGKLFGASIRCSASRLGTFAKCPYKSFARYVLELEERDILRFEPMDLGTFYHNALDRLFQRLKKEKKDFARSSDKELQDILHEEAAILVESDTSISNFVKRRAHNAYIISSAVEVLDDCAGAIAEMTRAGGQAGFRQKESEVWFGTKGKGQTQCEFEISDKRKIDFIGRIDRIDCADIDGRCVALLFDYKRKESSISWDEVYYGLDIQLAVYLLAVKGRQIGEQVIDAAAGAFYMPIEPGLDTGSVDDLEQSKSSFAYKAKGIFDGRFFELLDRNAQSQWSRYYNFHVSKGQPYGHFGVSGALRPEQFDNLLRFTRFRIIQLAEDMSSGQIDVRPYRLRKESPCSFCEYRPLCRFDWQINDYNFLTSIKKEQVLEKMGAVNGR